MKKQLLMFLFTFVLGVATQAEAILELRGEGTSVNGTHRLIYDTDLNITWYDYSPRSDAYNMNNSQILLDWAAGLSVDFGGTIFDDWRLPITQDSCWGTNCTNSEMGHLYYIDLGNSEGVGGFTNMGDFQSLGPMQNNVYWSETLLNTNPLFRYVFGSTSSGGNGIQTVLDIGQGGVYAIAVRSGDVAVVPEPISSFLFVTGGALLASRLLYKAKKGKLYV